MRMRQSSSFDSFSASIGHIKIETTMVKDASVQMSNYINKQ
jgi:hypothetical protein